jgi:hypothetical protein
LVDERNFIGHGFALFLTIRECPLISEDWKRLWEAYLVWLCRMGMTRCHWFMEWQRRGVPHMHAAVWFDVGLRDRDPYALMTLCDYWLAGAEVFGAGLCGQHVS